MAQNTSELREAITQSRAGQVRWRCPEPLREKIVEYARQRQGAGLSVLKVAQELGLSSSGLARWLNGRKSQLRPVRVAEVPSVSASAPLVLVTPGGYRLEGLSTASAAELLRRLAC